MPKKITPAKLACLDFNLQKAKMKLGVELLVEDPEQLDAMRQRSVQFHSYFNIRPKKKKGVVPVTRPTE